MSDQSNVEGKSIQQLEEEVTKHLRLVEALESLARAEEETATALLEFGLRDEAEEMLQRAAAHFRRATEETNRATLNRQRELELTRGDQ